MMNVRYGCGKGDLKGKTTIGNLKMFLSNTERNVLMFAI